MDEELDRRLEALESIVATLAKKQGVTEPQVARKPVPSPANQTIRLAQQVHQDAVAAHIRRILALGG